MAAAYRTREEGSALLLVGLMVGLAVAGGPHDVQGQSRLYVDRAYVASPSVLAMGNAGVALPRAADAFFYNPAFLARSEQRVLLLGVQGQFSTGVIDQMRFLGDRLQPALDEGLDALPDEELTALYNDTIERGYRPTTLNGAVLLPTFVWQQGPVGVGVGVFSYTDVTYRFRDAGLGVPLVELVGRTDMLARAGAGVQFDALGLPGLSVGLMGAVTRRYFAFENEPLDAIDAGADLVLLRGTSWGLDVGMHYDVPVPIGPGALMFGAAAYDIHTTGFDYTFHGTPGDLPIIGGTLGVDSDEPSAQRIDREVRRAKDRFAPLTMYRLGITYRLRDVAGLPGAAVAVDYLGYDDPPIDQSFLAHLHLGMSVEPFAGFMLRTGLSQGYPTAGAGLALGMVHIDYAFHGLEHGRYPGQIPSYQHTLQLLFTLY